jgi:hypothetical protein
MRIRIQIQGFDDQNLKKKMQLKKDFYFIDQKLKFTYPSASMKDVQATGEIFSSQKRTALQKMKFINFFYFSGSFFAHMDPDPDPRTPLNHDPIRIRIYNTVYC